MRLCLGEIREAIRSGRNRQKGLAKLSASGRFLFRPEKSSAGNFFVLGLQASQWAVTFYSLLFLTSSWHAWSSRTFCNAKMLGTLVLRYFGIEKELTNMNSMPCPEFLLCDFIESYIYITGFLWQAGDWQKRLAVSFFASLLLVIRSPVSYMLYNSFSVPTINISVK